MASALFFSACAAMLGVQASGNDRGLNIAGLIRLPVGIATAVYWVMSGMGVVFVAVTVMLAVFRVTHVQRVVVRTASITVPSARWSRKEVTVPFSEIVELSVEELHGQRWLKVVSPGGKVFVAASMLPEKEDFEAIHHAVRQGVEAARARSL